MVGAAGGGEELVTGAGVVTGGGALPAGDVATGAVWLPVRLALA